MDAVKLPFASEFSPSQVELSRLLELARSHAESDGDSVKGLDERIYAAYFSGYDSSEVNKRKLSMNCRLGMIAYGLIDRLGRLTQFGKYLLALVEEPEKLYEAFARHILLNLNGLAFVKSILEMQRAGEEVNLTTLRRGLEARGIHYPRGGKHPSMMRLWLKQAGVFIGDRWQVDTERLEALLAGVSDQYDALSRLTLEQKAFLRGLVALDIDGPIPASQIVNHASQLYGVHFPEKSLPKLVLNALTEAGFIKVEKTTAGRGAKPFLVRKTSKLEAELVLPVLGQLDAQTDGRLREMLQLPMRRILEEVDSEDRHVKGLALEALGFKLMRLLDLDYAATRLRGSATGGAEVDLIFESTRLLFTRWQIQCKNTGLMSLDDVAKEVGLTHFLKSNAIVVLSTGKISSEARRYANKVMTDSNLAIILLDDQDLKAILASPSSISEVFARQARHALSLKKINL